MKITSTKIIIAAAIAALFCSCSSKQDPYDIPVNYFLAVNDGSKIGLYKNDSLVFSYSEKPSCINDLAILDGEIELAGYVFDAAASRQCPALWVDGRLELPLPDSTGTITGVYRSGSDRYCSATLTGRNGTTGVLIKNGKVVYTSDAGITFDKFGIGASGDFYVAGRKLDAQSGQYNKAFLWRIQASDYELVYEKTVMSSDSPLVVNALQVGVYNIAVALEKQEEGSTRSAWGWLYDNRIAGCSEINISGPDSRAASAMFAGGYWYIGGARATTGDYAATIWRNGVYPIAMENQCNPGGSSVALLYFGGYNTYECVHSPRQIQLCRNGSLKYMITCSETTVPAAWAVVRQ